MASTLRECGLFIKWKYGAMTNGLFEWKSAEKMGAAVPLCPEMVEIFQSSDCRPQLSLLGLPGWSIFFSNNFRDFFFFPPGRSGRNQSWNSRGGRRTGRKWRRALRQILIDQGVESRLRRNKWLSLYWVLLTLTEIENFHELLMKRQLWVMAKNRHGLSPWITIEILFKFQLVLYELIADEEIYNSSFELNMIGRSTLTELGHFSSWFWWTSPWCCKANFIFALWLERFHQFLVILIPIGLAL